MEKTIKGSCSLSEMSRGERVSSDVKPEDRAVEAKDFRLWCSGGVYEPADADI